MKKHLHRMGSLVLLMAGLNPIGCGPSTPLLQTATAARSQGEGLGKDGDLMVTADQMVNAYAVLGADAQPGDTGLLLSGTSGIGLDALMPLVPADLLLVIEMQGADIDTSNTATFGTVIDINSAGFYEFVQVDKVDAATGTVHIASGCGGLTNRYQAAGHTQVIRVPQYSSVNVMAGGRIVAPAWNGQTGGIVALQVQNGATIDGSIDASGLGFRGGEKNPDSSSRLANVGSFYLSMNAQDGGNRGEGIAGYKAEYAAIGQYGRGVGANGGGGGNRIAAGGGGGGNGGLVADWNGEGQMSIQVTGGAQAWPLDPNYQATRTRFAGGGRGGYTSSTSPLDPTAIAPGSVTWGADSRRERGGLGGQPVPDDVKKQLFLGGGGGSGDDFMGTSGAGGSGGGLIFVDAQSITGSGTILARGTPGGNASSDDSGAGGGGAGGTIVLSTPSLDGVTVSTLGGGGGNQTASSANQAAGPGGGGGGGYIAAPTTTTATLEVSGGSGGVTNSTDMIKFPRNGASDGASGVSANTSAMLFGGAPFCANGNLGITLQTATTDLNGSPFDVTITVTNSGPSPMRSPSVVITVPDAARLTSFSASGWDCLAQAQAQSLRCTLPQLGVADSASFTITLLPIAEGMLTVSATVSAPAADPDPSNNQAQITVTNAGSGQDRLWGGGFSCSQIGASHSPLGWGAGGMWLLFAMTAGLGLRSRQHRRQKALG